VGKKGKPLCITFGNQFLITLFDQSKTYFEWAQKVREYVYKIGNEVYGSPNAIPNFNSIL
jgi:hypothetical protein